MVDVTRVPGLAAKPPSGDRSPIRLVLLAELTAQSPLLVGQAGRPTLVFTACSWLRWSSIVPA